MRFGIRLHTISRDTSEAAWAVADELLAELSPEQIAKPTQLHAKSESEGQRRMTALHGGRVDKLEIYPNLWAGVGLVRGGAGTALVGSHEEVANLIYEYHSVGFDDFILSGYPHLEEAYWFAEGVLPHPETQRCRLTSPVRGKPCGVEEWFERSPFIGFVPWIIYWVVADGPSTWMFGAICAVIATLIMGVSAGFGGLRMLDIVTVVFFVGCDHRRHGRRCR